MKTITSITAIVLLLSFGIAKGTIITVSNNPVGAGTYTDVQTAITAATVGDTIYVMGSPIEYNTGGINITKRLTIMGAGYAVSGTQTDLSTTIGTLNLDSVAFGSQVSGTHIIGLNVQGSISCTNYMYNNILVARCYCSGGIYTSTGSGWVIENNVITSIIDFYSSFTNVINNNIIRNNFIDCSLYANGQMIGSGLLVDHNIIEGQISTINYATVTNNVFFFADISASPNNAYNIYNDNITVYTTADVLPFGTNSGAGNINNVTPSDVYGSGLTASIGYPALLSDDWHLVSGSPGHNAATDGTDIGIYGGSLPMPNFTGASTLPQMELLNVKNSAIPVGGTLNYEFKARVEN